ncbi:MAG: ABC transporter permease [Patescibacteria group bacterium]|nr:ABC transporter permease [Patescibacteria group bacterium]
MINNQQIYQPAFFSQKNIFSLLPQMTRELLAARELIWRLFLRDFSAKYKQSLLGLAWIIILPLVGVSTFVVLNASGIFKAEDLTVPYVIYGLLGISLWQVFSSGWSTITNSLVSAGSFIVKINFSKEALVISSFGSALVEFFVRIILLLILFLFYGELPSFFILLLPFLILPLVLLTLGLGFITSLLNAVAKDAQTIINVLLGFFLFFMPIMYTTSPSSLIYRLNRYNPVYFLISVPRDLVLFGQTNDLIPFIYSSLMALIVFFVGWIIFYKAQSKIAEAV